MSTDPPPPGEEQTKETGASSWPEVDRRRQGGPTFWGWLRQTARLWGFLAFIALILVLFRTVILPFVLAVLVAYVLAPVLRFLCRVEVRGRRVPRFAWIIVVYAVLLSLVGLFTTSFVPRLTGDFKRIVKEAPAFWGNVRERYVPAVASWVEENFETDLTPQEPPRKPTAPSPPCVTMLQKGDGTVELKADGLQLEVIQSGKDRWLVRVPSEPKQKEGQAGGIVASINSYLERFVSRSESRVRQILGLGQKLVVLLLNTITTFILVLMISAFLLVDTEKILRWFRGLVPVRYFSDFDNVILLIDKGLSGAIRGQLMICVINGVLTWIGLVLIGVKYALLLGLLAGVMSLIPIFGSILSSIPIALVALASGTSGVDIIKGVLILAWIIGIHLLEANLLNPKIMGTAAKIHPVVVIFAVVAGERTYGPIGALLGVPLVSAVQAMFMYLRRKVRGELEPDEQQRVEGRTAG